MSRITTVPIKELYRLNSLRKDFNLDKVDHEVFTIPDYQRGYRWEADFQVEALLRDVFDFYKMERSSEDFYCLQPIVVTQSLSHEGAWEVIDGQQRLITLYLLLSALGEDPFELRFESRPKSNDFLADLIRKEEANHDDPDFHFMSEAWGKIQKWIKQKNDEERGFKYAYINVLLNNVKVIWYDVESTSRDVNIDVFNRLNIGKIPLNDAELVKALLLCKIKGKYKDEVELTMRQSEINNEWHQMEIELRKPQKWYFLTGGIEKNYDAHIEFLFDLMANTKGEAGQKYTTYLWFENQLRNAGNELEVADKAIELWAQVKNAYARVNSWFCDNSPRGDTEVYHYVGFLLASHEKRVYDIYNESIGKSSKDFRDRLKEWVKSTLKGVDIEELEYGADSDTIKTVLLLFNVLTCLKIANGAYNRFPFDRYNQIAKNSHKGWSLEHIFAQQSQDPIKDEKAAMSWLEETQKSIVNISCVYKPVPNEENAEFEECEIDLSEAKGRIETMIKAGLKALNLKDFNELRNEVSDFFGEADRHSISNLALLSAKDNSALNNAIFPVKRERIIELEKEGKFIPPCTRNVFLKFYSPSDSQPYYWSGDDQDNYLKQIKETLADFLN